MADMTEAGFSYDLDVFAIADYLIGLDELRPEPDVTPLKLAKLLYLAQANYLASTGRRMFDEPIEAYDNGPVVHRVWKRHQGRQIIATEPGPARAPTPPPDDVTDFLDAVWARYGDWSATRLWRLTHDQAPWKENYRPDEFRAVIPDADMTIYFREHVGSAERVFHPGVVVIDPDDLPDDYEAELFAANIAGYSGP